MLNSALPVEFLIDSGSSVNMINQDTFRNLESLMSLTCGRSFVKFYPYGWETPLPMLQKYVVETYSNCAKQYFMSLMVQYRVFLANLRVTLCFNRSSVNQAWTKFCTD